MRLWIATTCALLSWSLLACEDAPVFTDPCQAIDCSQHGQCVIVGGNPYCQCETGYRPEGYECIPVEVEDPCQDVTCSNHGHCEVVNGSPTCVCDDGYEPLGLQCIEPLQDMLVLAEGQTEPSEIAIDDQWVYWTAHVQDGMVSRVSKDGGTVEVVVSGVSMPADLYTDGINVYFRAGDDVMSAPVGGGEAKVLYNHLGLQSMACDGRYVYTSYRDWQDIIVRVPVGGGDPYEIMTRNANISRLTCDSQGLYWTEYKASNQETWLNRTPLPGGGVDELCLMPERPAGLYADADFVYWSEQNRDRISAYDLIDAHWLEFAPTQDDPSAITSDEKYTYWANTGQGTLVKKVKRPGDSGSIHVEIAANQVHPSDLAVDDNYLFRKPSLQTWISQRVVGPVPISRVPIEHAKGS
jgi:hypothetical protein